MKKISTLLSLAALLTVHGLAQMNHTMVGEDTIKVSDHVWAIMGFPNIAIVVGNHATLVALTCLQSLIRVLQCSAVEFSTGNCTLLAM